MKTSIKITVSCLRKHGSVTAEMLEEMYPCTDEAVCPVELIAHGLPHRVLKRHQD